MQLADVTFNDLISPGGIQFVIPVWQRLYSWEEKQWEDLWDDLQSLYEKTTEGKNTEHFLGPIVVKTVEEKVGEITRRILIDGQQRFTTLLVICSLLRDRAKKEKKLAEVSKIEDYFLFNRYTKNPDSEFKLLPSEADRKAFQAIARAKNVSELSDGSQLSGAYEFFSNKLDDNNLRTETLLKCIQNLKMVSINLRSEDDPNRIFETLNSRGRDLDQSDLVRNYFMMSMKNEKLATQLYADEWFPMQQSFGRDTKERLNNLELFLRHYLVMRSHSTIKENEVYERIQKRLRFKGEEEKMEELKIICKYARYYQKLLFPSQEKNVKIRRGIDRLNRLDVGVSYPFLLRIYRLYSIQEPKIDEDDFVEILNLIESYIIRRLFHRLKPNSLNKVFASLCELDSDKLSSKLTKVLNEKESWSVQYFPDDDDFREDIKSCDIYHSGACDFILESFEESIGHPEPVKSEELTIEHVMPETLNSGWEDYLGPKYEKIYSDYCHTLGNLTLVAGRPNSKISNDAFESKRQEWYFKSNVSLTKEIASKWHNWRRKQIEERAEMLADRAIKIWPHPD